MPVPFGITRKGIRAATNYISSIYKSEKNMQIISEAENV